MKKSFCIGWLMLLCATLAQAQQKVIITLNDGTIIERYVWEVNSITFGDAGYNLLPIHQDIVPVDLGLSVKWAPFNLTAYTTNPEYGDDVFTHFGWGDVTGINQTNDLSYFPVLHPAKSIVNSEEYDIAQKLWGDKWRLPTVKEVQELIEKCDWTWTSDGNISGYLVTSQMAGNQSSIFLPVGGLRLVKDTLDKDTGFYWTGIRHDKNDEKAFLFSFSKIGKPSLELETLERYYGLFIRPVYGDVEIKVDMTIKLLNCNENNVSNNLHQADLQATYTVSGDVDRVIEYGILWGKENDNLKYDGNCSKVKGSELLVSGSDNLATFTLTDLTEDTSYKVCPYVVVEGSTEDSQDVYYGGSLMIKTASRFPVPKYVDMGVSVDWAEWDMGASSPNEFGLYYGWGAISDSLISTNPYDYATGFTGQSIAKTKYDVAYMKWGEGWRMPTKAEFEELEANCNWVREDRMSPTGALVSGYRLTSKTTNNSIFLPAGGYYYGTQSDKVNNYVLLWTADIDSEGTLPVYYRWAASGLIPKTNDKPMRTLIRAVHTKNTNSSGTSTNAVDLGLSVKWAKINLGAKKETDAGYYIAWGDTLVRTNYSGDAYIHYNGSSYVDLGDDFNGNHSYKWDAARHYWGGAWRVPTEREMSELWTRCTWIWTTKNGVNGFSIKGPNGNTIFLPAAGYKQGANATLYQNNRYGSYWTSSRDIRNADYGLNLQFNSDLKQFDEYGNRITTANPLPGIYREYGLTIRPVCP